MAGGYNLSDMSLTVFAKKAVKAITIIMPLAVILTFLNDIFNSWWADDSRLSLNSLGTLIVIGFVAWAVMVIAASFFRTRRNSRTGTDQEKENKNDSNVVDATGWKVK